MRYPALFSEQPLEVLASPDQERLDVHPPKPTEPEPDFLQHLCLDRGYDNEDGRDACVDHDYDPRIALSRDKRPPQQAGANEMRIVVSDFISLDGVVQAPGQPKEDTDGGFTHGGWSMAYFDPDAMGPVLEEIMAKTEALLFGRRTWQIMAAAWPKRAGDPFADRMNEIQKYVASRTLSQHDLHWSNSTLLPADDVVGAVRRLRARDGGDMQVMGSASLARTLISNDLVDEYRLMIEPILLGGGKRLFPDDGRSRPLKLVSTTTSSTGVHVCTYHPGGSSST